MAFIIWTGRVGTRELLDICTTVGLYKPSVVANVLSSCRASRKQLLPQQQQRGFASQAGDSNSATQDSEHGHHVQSLSQLPPPIEAAGAPSAAAEDVLLRSSSGSSSTVTSRTLASTATSSNLGCGSSVNNISSSSSSSNSAGLISPALLAQVSSTLNQLTGYESIDAIKGSVGSTDQQLQDVKRALQTAKVDYEAQLAKQNQLHREVTALLQRKSSWVPADVARFTELYAAEHQTEQAVAAAKARYSQLSDDAEQLQLKLVDLIRERYQQEQLWSDKIRRASTWWTWGLMGLHFASFVVVYTFLEPRKRAALQAAVADMLTQHVTNLDNRIMQLAPGSAAAAQGAASAAEELPSSYEDGASSTGAVKTMTQAQQQQLVFTQDAQQEFQSQHVVLQELQALRQQLDSLQTALPATAAAAAAPAGLPASNNQLPEQEVRATWRLPGVGWATAQLAAAGRSGQKLWQHSKQQAERVIEQFHMGRSDALKAKQASGSSSSEKSTGVLQQQRTTLGSVDSAKQDPASFEQNMPGQKQQAMQAAQQQEQPVLPAIPAAGDGLQHAETAAAATAALPARTAMQAGQHFPELKKRNSLLQQLRSDEKVLEMTRAQLLAIAAAANVAGAALAAVLVLVLRSSGGAAGSSG